MLSVTFISYRNRMLKGFTEISPFIRKKVSHAYLAFFPPPGAAGGRGGRVGGLYPPKLWVGVRRTVLKILTLFQTKIYDFPYPFSDLTPKICSLLFSFSICFEHECPWSMSK